MKHEHPTSSNIDQPFTTYHPIVASFEISPSTTKRQSLRPLRQSLDALDLRLSLSAHSTVNFEEKEDVWVLNPETKRKIRKDGPKWQEIMNERGGYIYHNSNLVPIQLDNLWVWIQTEKSTTINEANNKNELLQKAPNTAWERLVPEILPLDEEDTRNGVDKDSLPVLDELLFAFKPSGLLTLPGMGEDKQICLASLVNDWIPANVGFPKQRKLSSNNDKKKKRKKKPEKPFVPRPCHRLDYDTSGVMVVGLTRDALRLTNAMFEQKGMESSTFLKKTYVALVAGNVVHDQGTINFPIGKIFNKANGYNEFVCLTDDSEWKADDFVEKSLRNASTRYSVLNRFTLLVEGSTSDPKQCIQYTKVKLEPLTGRGHQLRLHMAAIGHPILGDTLHAPLTVAAATPRLCLHAEELELNVSIDGEGDFSVFPARVRARSIPPF